MGEIHLDHARVTYTKDRFDRNDPAWDEMVLAVRGRGPLRPDKADQSGFPLNMSPLSLLFQAFRRSNPVRRVAGGYGRLLMVRDNDRALEMARRFYEGDVEYQSDAKWYELVQQADRELLTDQPGGPDTEDESRDLEGFGTSPEPTRDVGSTPDDNGPTQGVAQQNPTRLAFPPLTRNYASESIGLQWNVEGFYVSPNDLDLGGEQQPWRLLAKPEGKHLFLVNQQHPVFQSATMTPLDALLGQLAWTALDFARGQSSNATYATVLAELRERYAVISKLDPSTLSVEASSTLTDIGRSLRMNIDNDDGNVLFRELSISDQDAVQHRMAVRTVPNPQAAISQGRFLEYAPPRILLSFVQAHPELFLDGQYWETPYSSLDYGSDSATEEAQARVVQYYVGLLADAVWLADQDPSDLAEASRERLLRAALALDLLGPSVEVD